MKTSQYIIIVVHSIRNWLRTQTITPGIKSVKQGGITESMQQNILPLPTSKLSFKVQFFAETYFRVFKSFAKIAKIRSREKG